MIKSFVILLGALTALPALAQSPTAYTNARIYPVSGPVIANGTVLVSNGKISACGSHVVIPSGAVRVDLHGATVIPGLVDASSSLFLTDETLTGSGTADQNVLDGLDPFDKDALKVLARGITTVYISPGSRGGVGGLGAVVKLQNGAASKAGAPVLETTLKAKAGVQLALGLSSGGRSSSLDRISSYQSLRALFLSAQQYAKLQDKAAKDKAAAAKKTTPTQADQSAVSEQDSATDTEDATAPQRRQFPRGGPGAGRPQQSAAPRAQPAQEVLASALKGEIPVRIEAHRIDDILNALRLADEFKFKLILEAPTEAAGIVGEIAAHKASVIWSPGRSAGVLTLETVHFAPDAVAALDKAGIKLAVSARSGSGAASRFLVQTAAMAAGDGLTTDKALRTITLGAAELLGVADKVGSLSPGKDADMVILSGSPWAPETIVKRVIVNGVQVYGAL